MEKSLRDADVQLPIKSIVISTVIHIELDGVSSEAQANVQCQFIAQFEVELGNRSSAVQR